MVGIKVFVFSVFLLIAISFVAPTAVLLVEFADADWLTLAAFYSHLFIFFPTLGVVTLFAFYTPACVFTDMYWRKLRLGRVRFATGVIVVAAVSFIVAGWLGSGRERSIFEIAPQVLKADKGEPAGCGTQGGCRRLAILEAAGNVRAVSQQRIGLTDLARSCRADPLIEAAPVMAQRKRFCFASTPLRTSSALVGDAECCQAQREIVSAIGEMYEPRGQRSLTGLVHHAVLPGKIFFMLVLLIISMLLAFRHRGLARQYETYLPGIERGVLIGAAAMVIYPIMSHAFLQSAVLLYGGAAEVGYRAVAPYFTAAFGAWALLLLFFFFKVRDQDVQLMGRLGGAMAGGFAVLKYDLIIDICVRVFGSGAPAAMLAAVAAAAVLGIIALFVRTSEELSEAQGTSRTGDAA